jgi:hypothetical protein
MAVAGDHKLILLVQILFRFFMELTINSKDIRVDLVGNATGSDSLDLGVLAIEQVAINPKAEVS